MKSSMALRSSPKLACVRHGFGRNCECDCFDLSSETQRHAFVKRQQDMLHRWGLKWHLLFMVLSLVAGFAFPQAGGLYGYLLFGLAGYVAVLAVTLPLVTLAKRYKEKRQIRETARLIDDPTFVDVRLERDLERVRRREKKRAKRDAARLRRMENNAKYQKLNYS